MSKNSIYYLLNFHKQCIEISRYGESTQKKYCHYVNEQLNTYFTPLEIKQLQMQNFDISELYEFAYGVVENISFDQLDEIKLNTFFENISFIDVKELR